MANLEECVIADILHWMAFNFLQVNDNKTKLIFLGTSQNLSKPTINSLQIGDSKIEALQHVHNIGAIFD